MKSIFEDLCCMNDSKLMENKKYRAAYDKFAAQKEDFLLMLNPVQQKLFDKLNDCHYEVCCLERNKSFTDGFKLGMFMYHEAFSENPYHEDY